MNRPLRSVSASLVILGTLILLRPLPAFGLPAPGPVVAVAIDPLNPKTLYAGTAGGGVFKSTDGGMSWSPTSLTNVGVSALAIAPRTDPADPAILFASTDGGDVFKSIDGGASWAWILSSSLYPGVSPAILDLAIDPLNPNLVALGTTMATGWFEDGEGYTIEGAVFRLSLIHI